MHSFFNRFFGIACFLLMLFAVGCTPQTPPARSEAQIPAGVDRAWWKEGVVYQIYPRSFKDTDGDGVGDLRGIIEELDYIESLGVDIIWLNPIYSSPNADNGYDISDYEEIMAEFGTMADFEAMLQGFHDRDIRLVMDLVVNHSSDEHDWFLRARSSRDNPYRDFYHWWPAERGEPPYRRGFFDPAGEGWHYDSTTNAYYLHYFGEKQPDLNWEHPALRDSVYRIMRNWFDKGVDGFRMDVIPFISKDTTWPRLTEAELRARYGDDYWARYYADGPYLHDYLKEMNREVLRDYDVMALGEGAGVTIDDALKFVAKDRQELDLFFHFDGQLLGYSDAGYKRLDSAGWSLDDFKAVYTRWNDVFAEEGWGSIYLGNHDQPRMVTRWGDDSPAFHEPSAKLLHTFLLSMRATPFIYHGDELGMTNIRFDSIGDYRDIETLSWYEMLSEQGRDLRPYMEDWKITARDNGRTPFQWDASPNAGFTSGKPWIRVNPNYPEINAAAQQGDPNSILNYFRKMVRLREAQPVLVYGDYALIRPEHPQVYAYTRTLGEERALVLLNFSDETASLTLPAGMQLADKWIDNYDGVARTDETLQLKPYQAAIFALQ